MRAFISLSAAALVCAFAVAALMPPQTDLGTILLQMDPHSLVATHGFLASHGMPGLWRHVLLPFLRRPGWLVPFSLAVITGGIALSLSFGGQTRQRTRRSG